MVDDSMKPLQFDRRLRKRRGRASEGEFQAHLDSLPDVADKGEVISHDGASDAPAAAAPSAEPGSPDPGSAGAAGPGSGSPLG